MKNLNIIAVVCIVALSIIFGSCIGFLPVMGNGELVTTQKSVSAFDKIDLAGNAEVRFIKSAEEKILVTVDSNLENFTEIVVRGDKLIIGTKFGIFNFTKYLVDIYSPNALDGVSISGSGKFSSDEIINASQFDTVVSGSGSITVSLECEELSAVISGSGSMNITGTAENLELEISGSGKFDGFDFIVEDADVEISGSGKANIHVTESLDAVITGSGEINYRGNPSDVDDRITGLGDINRL
ncbi:MAG: DUF2807 domain-containing protein [Treponema sp.]|jgi:hypothetical protein|nr:DUF2807 domain-containing protein [Treponema sp.]